MVSLNEIETVALKAVRGAGFAWGMAEDMAHAARWLAAYELDAVAALAAFLDGSQPACDPHCTVIGAGTLVAAAGIEGLPIRTDTLRAPVFLLPFAAQLVAESGRRLVVTWPGVRVGLEPAPGKGVRLSIAGDVIASPGERVAIEIADDGFGGAGRLPSPGERQVEAGAWQRLMALEKRTYVPASTTSRATGAGAGTSDRD